MSQALRFAIVPCYALRPRGLRCYRSATALLAGLLLLSGCATSPFPKELREQAKLQPTFLSLALDPDAYKGTTAIIGGSIIKTSNLKEFTEIEILQKELDSDYMPKDIDKASGRFLARCKEFLDPEIFKAGRDISLAGEVQGKDIRPLGEVSYTYLVVSCRKVKLWHEKNGSYYYPYPPYGYGGYWGYGWYGGPYPFVPVFPRHMR